MSTGSSIITSRLDGIVIDVECHITKGLSGIVIVGFANKAADGAKERRRGAFSNTQLELPRKRITVNLAPGDIPEDSTSFDLAIAATAILAVNRQMSKPVLRKALFIGDPELDGSVHPIRGIVMPAHISEALQYRKRQATI